MRMDEIAMDLEDLMRSGHTPEEASEILIQAGCPLLRDELIRFCEGLDLSDPWPLDESMDGDFDTGMTSAGWGTDEDYGGDCERL